MSRLISSLDLVTAGIQRDIGSQYDRVRIVAEQIGEVIAVANALESDNIDFSVLAEVLSNIKDSASDLAELAKADLVAISDDLVKNNFLGNRKVDINLALNMQGIDENVLRYSPDDAKAIWLDPGNTVFYDSATITFVDGTVVELPFEFDGNPVEISTHGDLLAQLNRFDNQTAVAQEVTINNIVAVDGYTYRVTINGVAFDYLADADATVPEIVSGLVQAINVTEANGSVPVTAIDQVTSIKLVADVAGEEFISYGNGNMTFSTTVANVEGGAVENPFLAKLEGTSMLGSATDVVGEIVRFVDVIGNNSNLERIQLNATRGKYIVERPLYYWAKTTSALQTLSMRAGDIIKLGNELDNIITLASSINEVIELQGVIPQLVDTFQEDGTPNGTTTVYNKLNELQTIYDSLQYILSIYEDMKDGGNNYIEAVATDFQSGASKVVSVGADLQDVNSKVTSVANNLQSPTPTIDTVGEDLQLVNSNVVAVGNDLVDVNSTVKTVSTNLQKPVSDIVVVSNDLLDLNSSVKTVSADLLDANSNVIAVGQDLNSVDSAIIEVSTNLKDPNSSVTTVSNNLQDANSTVNSVGTDLINAESKIKEVADDLQSVNSKVVTVADNLQLNDTSSVNTVASNINNVNAVGSNITALTTTSSNIDSINVVSTNITDVLNADANAQTAIDKALEATQQASIATTQAASATASATTAAQQATIATTKANEIKSVAVESTITGAAGTNAAVVYNPTTGKFTFVVPQGVKGDRGEAFAVNAVGLLSSISLYDTQLEGFSFLAIDESKIYFKLSDAVGDWSLGAPFGKGDKGDKGDTGTGIAAITFTSTDHISGLASQSGGTDIYTITFTDSTTTTFTVYNGLDSELLSVAGRVGDVVLTKDDVGLSQVDNTADLDKPVSTATQIFVNNHTSNNSNPHNVTKTQVGLGNVDNTSDINKPISTAVQSALDLKANTLDIGSVSDFENTLV